VCMCVWSNCAEFEQPQMWVLNCPNLSNLPNLSVRDFLTSNWILNTRSDAGHSRSIQCGPNWICILRNCEVLSGSRRKWNSLIRLIRRGPERRKRLAVRRPQGLDVSDGEGVTHWLGNYECSNSAQFGAIRAQFTNCFVASISWQNLSKMGAEWGRNLTMGWQNSIGTINVYIILLTNSVTA